MKAPLGLRELLGVSDPHGHVLEALGQEGYEAAFAKGRQMTIDQAVALIVRFQDETWGPGDPARERTVWHERDALGEGVAPGSIGGGAYRGSIPQSVKYSLSSGVSVSWTRSVPSSFMV